MNQKPDVLAEVVAALKRGLGDRLVAVLLFGSRARGEADEGSDWDLLVIARELPDRTLERHMRLKKALPVAWRGRVAILARTPEEFEARLSSLYLDIALDGIVLYDPDDYMTRRLAGLRRLIEERGLYRERVRDGLVWRWERFPGFDWALEWEAAR
ncbi:MAG TPA: nucleotidyltransferase domain-containing protein [Anaerolineae bacterium]|nr:nucleotidyltransferase domain-containing protein [Anaerolineae bacterium]